MTFDVNNEFSKGDVLLNTIKLIKNFKGKYLQSLAYTVEAKPKAGHTFRYWDINIDNVSSKESGILYSGIIAAKATNVVITAVYDNDSLSETKMAVEDTSTVLNDENTMNLEASEKKVAAEEIIESFNAKDILVYPVPIKEDILTIDAPENTITQVEFYTINGTLIKRLVPQEMPIDVSFLKKGVYMLRIYTRNGVVVKKIIK